MLDDVFTARRKFLGSNWVKNFQGLASESLTDVTQANEESMTYKAKNNCKLLIVRSRCVTSDP
ncbi:hypothetical protein CRENPOLYSF1_300061 [Crenothrix polyspora]|uniref:Uncharacterized protein n=1 Tax=Crenothrix polyspora TaxID=360316 RepID=A0A1R4H8U8_9GAMM|nr:hypothetical protein CRENPOLYSF1_300061 [Crenothrix polyspora]